jgi:hypothetical protein
MRRGIKKEEANHRCTFSEYHWKFEVRVTPQSTTQHTSVFSLHMFFLIYLYLFVFSVFSLFTHTNTLQYVDIYIYSYLYHTHTHMMSIYECDVSDDVIPHFENNAQVIVCILGTPLLAYVHMIYY